MKFCSRVSICLSLLMLVGSANAGSPSAIHHLAQIGAGGGIQSVLLVLNPNPEPVFFRLDLYAGDGSPLELTLADRTNSSFDLYVPPDGTVRLVLSSDSPTPRTGWGRIWATAQVGAQLLFEIYSSGELATQAAVEPLAATNWAELFVNTESGNTGIALANISTQDSILVRFTLKDRNGVELGTEEREIPALGHVARFVSEYFAEAGEVEGALEVAATGKVVLVTLQQTGLVLGTLPPVTP